MAKPLFPWMGGKSRLANSIVPLLPSHTCYVEPFAGAGGIFFAKSHSQVEVLNDINGEIVNLYRVVRHHLEELYKQFKWILVSREQWEWMRDTPPETLTDVQRAARFLYLQKLAFGGRAVSPTFGTAATTRPKFNLLTLEHDLVEAHARLAQVTLEQGGWEKMFERYDRPDTLFYCDPPYYETAGYGVDFGVEQYELMAGLGRESKGKVVISLNDHPAIREIFRDFEIHSMDYEYTVGGGAKDKRQACKELVILNNNAVEQQGGLFGLDASA